MITGWNSYNFREKDVDINEIFNQLKSNAKEMNRLSLGKYIGKSTNKNYSEIYWLSPGVVAVIIKTNEDNPIKVFGCLENNEKLNEKVILNLEKLVGKELIYGGTEI